MSELYLARPLSNKLKILFQVSRLLGRISWMLRGSPSLIPEDADSSHKSVRKILIARGGRLGDSIAFMPTLRVLREAYPSAYIVFAYNERVPGLEVLSQEGLVNEMRQLDFLKHRSAAKNLIGFMQLLREGFDLVITGATYLMTSEALFSGAPFRAGIDDGNPFAAMLNYPVKLDSELHEAENCLRLVERLGLSVRPDQRVPCLSPRRDPLQRRKLFARLGLSENKPLIALHAGAAKLSRRWPPEYCSRLIEMILAADSRAQVVLTGVSYERELLEDVKTSLPESLRARVLIAAGSTTLEEFFVLLSNCDLFICNDTGVMHVARALGAPLVATLGPENHMRWGPHPKSLAPAIALRHQVQCAPCVKSDCAGLYCLRLLTPEEVYAACESILSKPRRTAEDSALELRLQRDDYSGFAADFELPSLAVVLLGAEREGDPANTAELLSILDRQSYPNASLYLASPSGGGEVAGEGKPADFETELRYLSFDPAAEKQLTAVLQQLDHEYVTIVPAECLDQLKSWSLTRLSEELAALYRIPGATASLSSDTWGDVYGGTHRLRSTEVTPVLRFSVTLRRTDAIQKEADAAVSLLEYSPARQGFRVSLDKLNPVVSTKTIGMV